MKNLKKIVNIVIFTLIFCSCNSLKQNEDKNEDQNEISKINPKNIVQMATLPKLPTFKYHYISDEEIEESFYKERIPKTYVDAFLYYTKDHKELRMPFYSIMVHESANFKVYKRRNTNGSYDLGPSHLNTNNIKNAYFRELYNPKDESHITNVYCFYMIMSLNYFRDMVDKFDGNMLNAYYAYNGGQKAPSIINSKYIPKNKIDFVKNVKAYGNVVKNYVSQFNLELDSYRSETYEKIASGVEYLNKNIARYSQYTDVFIQYDENNVLQMKLVKIPSLNTLALNNFQGIYKTTNNVIINIRREDNILYLIKEEIFVA